MNHRITLLTRSVSRDAMGGEVVTWNDAGDDWAEVTPLTGREYFQAMQENAEYEIRFRVRYRSDVEQDWRLIWRGKQYDVLRVIDVAARMRTTEMHCRTAPN
jgi:SPP1 family predicted phage head-tail adaptor